MEMRIDRLQVLQVLLEELAADEVKRKHFNLAQWIGEPFSDTLFAAGSRDSFEAAGMIVGKTINAAEVLECGFAGCAIGWAGMCPTFKKQGFRIEIDECDDIVPTFGLWHHWEAVEVFFGLAPLQAVSLFAAQSYTDSQHGDPLAVARRIEELLETTTWTAQ
jgi:hypothetical protein